MAMYYYARKLQKGASSSSSSSSSRHGKNPPVVNINGSIPCCSSQSNGPVGLPPPPPCVMMGVNGGLVSGGNYRFQPHHHHQHLQNPPHHHQHQQHSPHSTLHHHQQHPHHHQQTQTHHHHHQQHQPHSHHSPHHPQTHHHHQSQQVPCRAQQQQHLQYRHFQQTHHLLNGPCCCGGGGGTAASSGTNTPNLGRRPLSHSELDYEDDYDNEEVEEPVLCKVHHFPSSTNPSSSSYCDNKPRGASSSPRGGSGGGGCSGGAGAASCPSLSHSLDSLAPEERKANRDLLFNGPHLISGTWEALVHHLLPTPAHFPDHDYIFAFLLSARLYVQPHELLGRVFQEVIDVSADSTCSQHHHQHGDDDDDDSPTDETTTHHQQQQCSPHQSSRSTSTTSAGAHGSNPAVTSAFAAASSGLSELPELSEDDIDLPLDVIPLLVKFLRPWTELFPYDFRDDRMMAHVRSLAHKCVETDEEVREQVSQLLAALLSRLAALEKYEEFLHRITTEASIGEPIAAPSVVTICPDPATMAEQLTLVELQRFSFIGPEEFVQTLGKEDLKTGVRHCDCVNRKTKNLEAYVRWFQRLTYYVASEICKMSKKKSRWRVCEYWIQVAKECLNIRNFNSLMAILAGLNILPVARLKKTWNKPLNTELAEVEKAVDPQQNYAPYRKLYKAAVWQCMSTTAATGDSQTYRILVPYFSLLMKDLYNLDSVHPSRLPNGHIDFEKCRQLAKLVTEITSWQKVQCDFVQIQSIFNSVQASPIFNEQELIYASYLCEQPETPREKEQFKKLHRQNFQVPLIACNSSSENDT